MAFAQLDPHINLYYHQQGAGEPLVLIAGLGADHRTWSKIVGELSQHFLVIMPENRGAGRSTYPDKPYSIDEMADDIAHLLHINNINSAYMVGHSMGGSILQSLCLRYPGKVKAALMAGSCAQAPLASLMQMNNMIHLAQANVAPKWVLEALMPWLFGETFLKDPENVSFEFNYIMDDPFPQSLEGYKGQVHALSLFDYRQELRHIESPTLVLAGEEDLYVPARFSQFVAENIPRAQYQFLQGCGHMFQREKSAELTKIILDFFKSL